MFDEGSKGMRDGRRVRVSVYLFDQGWRERGRESLCAYMGGKDDGRGRETRYGKGREGKVGESGRVGENVCQGGRE